MLLDPGEELVMKQGLFLQERNMNPFRKWLLCGINGSCTNLNTLAFIRGGAAWKASFTGIITGNMLKQDGSGQSFVNTTEKIVGFNRTIVNQNYSPAPVCVPPPCLFFQMIYLKIAPIIPVGCHSAGIQDGLVVPWLPESRSGFLSPWRPLLPFPCSGRRETLV